MGNRIMQFYVIESHKSPCNIPANTNRSKWFVIGVFMAQSYATKSAEADYILRVWFGNNKL